MNGFDIIVLVILGFCLIRGIFRGLIKELASMMGVGAGFFAAYAYYRYPAGFLGRWVETPAYANILAFLILFCGVLVLVSLLGMAAKHVLQVASLGWVDRTAGAGFGCIKGVLIVSVLLMALTAFLPRGHSLIGRSVLASPISFVSTQLARLVSKDMKRAFGEKVAVLERIWMKKK